MEEQAGPYSFYPPSRDKQHRDINQHRWPEVQRVKANAAAVGSENRVGKQVVEVDGHTQEHQAPGTKPDGAEKEPCQQTWC